MKKMSKGSGGKGGPKLSSPASANAGALKTLFTGRVTMGKGR